MKKIKKKIRFYKLLLIEIVETLVSICQHLRRQDHTGAFGLHIDTLKSFSKEMMKEIDNELN